MFNWFTIQVWDPDWGMYEDKTLFRVITRSLSNSVLFFIIFIREIFLGGYQTVSSILGDGITKSFSWIYIPALPWTAVVIGAFIIGYKLEGIRLAIIASIGFLYVSIFGQWEPSANFIFNSVYCTGLFYTWPIFRYLGLFKQKSRGDASAHSQCSSNNASLFLFSSNKLFYLVWVIMQVQLQQLYSPLLQW